MLITAKLFYINSRMVGSSHAGLFASISAGVSALGPLHGGANQAVLEMLGRNSEKTVAMLINIGS
jgi:citrate synthase